MRAQQVAQAQAAQAQAAQGQMGPNGPMMPPPPPVMTPSMLVQQAIADWMNRQYYAQQTNQIRPPQMTAGELLTLQRLEEYRQRQAMIDQINMQRKAMLAQSLMPRETVQNYEQSNYLNPEQYYMLNQIYNGAMNPNNSMPTPPLRQYTPFMAPRPQIMPNNLVSM